MSRHHSNATRSRTKHAPLEIIHPSVTGRTLTTYVWTESTNNAGEDTSSYVADGTKFLPPGQAWHGNRDKPRKSKQAPAVAVHLTEDGLMAELERRAVVAAKKRAAGRAWRAAQASV